MQMREKVGKSRTTVFFQWFVAPEGRKVGSLKRRVRSHLARREMKNCTLLWRKAHFQVKMYKTHQVRTTFGSWECTPSWREAHLEVKMCKTCQLRTTFGSWDIEKVHAVVAWSTFWSQHVKNTRGSDHCWKFRCRKSARRCGAKHFLKSKVQKTDVYGTLLDVWRSLAEVLRLWCCQLWQMRKSRRIASFLMWSSSKNEEVSQNCFVFDVVNFKKWGSLAEVLRFWCCQLEKMKMSRRIARFSSLQIDR